MKLNLKYLLAFVVILVIESLIAIYIHDDIIRPYIGDILVVILMYTFIRAFIDKRLKWLPVYLFGFATAIEMAQHFNLLELLNLQGNKIARIILGSSFDVKDILCYLIGTVIIIAWEFKENIDGRNVNRNKKI